MLKDFLVRDWMAAPVISISSETRIVEAHQIMKEHGIRRLPVIESGKLVGLITLGDVREASPSKATTLSIWELNYLWSNITVRRIMQEKVYTISTDSSLIAAAQLMMDKKISGLPVVDNDDQVVGMLTESDIFRMIVSSQLESA